MNQVCLEYIWVDGKGQLRSKTRVISADKAQLYQLPGAMPEEWNYDGSSTYQRFTSNSEVFLYPKVMYPDPMRGNPHKLVLCETSDDKCSRKAAREIFKQNPESQPMFGLEQEFFIYDRNTEKPLGWPSQSFAYPAPQGDYYCSVGSNFCFARPFMEQVLQYALFCGIEITGYNWEVAPGQAEFQVCAVGIDAADQLTLLRYLLLRTGEAFNYVINFEVKPYGDWNGSGMHVNFSTKEMREPSTPSTDSYTLIEEAIDRLRVTHSQDMQIMGKDNEKRLTGIHETSSVDIFSVGVASRDTSIRIPTKTRDQGYGYFEDRRPGSNIDPYLVTANMYQVCCLNGKSICETHPQLL